MDIDFLLAAGRCIASLLLVISLSAILFLKLSERSSKKNQQVLRAMLLPEKDSSGILGDAEEDITMYSVKDIPKVGLFSASERKTEYRRRGKSPSGVIDGVYNDMYLEDGNTYNDMDRDWDADA